MKTTITSYEQQAIDFLKKTNSEIKIEFLKNDYHFVDDDKKRDIYKVTISRGARAYKFNFGNSLARSRYYLDGVTGDKFQEGKDYYYSLNANKKVYKEKFFSFLNVHDTDEKYLIKNNVLHLGEAPSKYDILTCLTTYDPGTIEDFCDNFGYDIDSKKAEKVFKGVKEEYNSLCTLYTDEEMGELSEI